MANLAVKLTALIFLFFAVSHAQNDAVTTEEFNAQTTLDTPETTSFQFNIEKNDNPVPLTMISFQPINRPFSLKLRGPIPMTFGRDGRCRRCSRRSFSGEQLTYGNDMILSSNDKSRGFDLGLRGQIHHHRFDSEDEIHWPRHHHRRHHRHDFDELDLDREHHDHHHDHHHHDHHENVLLKSLRKFLGHF